VIRFAGSTWSMRLTRSCAASATPHQRADEKFTCPDRMALLRPSSSRLEVPREGDCAREHHTEGPAPRLQTSTSSPKRSPATISGALKWELPTSPRTLLPGFRHVAIPKSARRVLISRLLVAPWGMVMP